MQEQSEETRLAMKDAALSSTYYMGKVILGFIDMTVDTHKPMCDFMDTSKRGYKNRKLGLAPRDHLKTSCWTIADCVRRVAADPNIRILLGNETATNASHMLRRIEAVFERNNIFQWLFPDLIQDFNKAKKWSETEMLVPRSQDHPESTIEVIGVGGAVVSRHFNLIKLDDLVGKEASESEEVMRKTISWYQYCESLLVHPDDEIHLYGTRWGYHDVYSWAEENEPYLDKFFRNAEDNNYPNGCLWPERFNLEVLERIKKKMGTFKYSCQYLNNPYDPEGMSFKASDLRYYKLEDGECKPELGGSLPLAKMRKFMRVDPAISEKDHAARTAIVVDAVDSLNRKFLLEVFAERCNPKKMFDVIFDLYRKWDCESCGVENVAYQKAIQYFLADECTRRGQYINIRELKPDGQKKPVRIRALQPYFERGEVHILREQDDFKQEYLGYPVAKTVDILDAFAYGPTVWEIAEDDNSYDDTDQWIERSGHDGRSLITGY